LIVIDSSALVAILLGEPERNRFIDAVVESGGRHLSVVNHFEVRTVLLRKVGEDMVRELMVFLQASRVEVHAFDRDQADAALAAYRRFGKGSGHKAQLNLCDCAAYALAQSLDLPLLCKGDDFAHTDVRSALA
jgi:ribonuclease VapC